MNNDNGLDFLYNFSEQDKEFFEKHGIDTSEIKIEHMQLTYVGKIETENGHVDLWAEFAPAVFWEAEVHSNVNGKTYKVSTGSGSLTYNLFGGKTYWSKMVRLMNGENLRSTEMF